MCGEKSRRGTGPPHQLTSIHAVEASNFIPYLYHTDRHNLYHTDRHITITGCPLPDVAAPPRLCVVPPISWRGYGLNISIDYISKSCYVASHPRSSRGVSGDDPEGGAGSGVLRRRLVTAGPGRPGTPPARHYDLTARSSLHGSGRQLPAVVGRRAPKETEARPRGPKPPRWSAERRASRVMGRKAPR
jgi:hypothetical protein